MNQHRNHIGVIVPIYGWASWDPFEIWTSGFRFQNFVVSHYAKFLLGIWFLFLLCKDSEGQWGILLDTSLSLKPMSHPLPQILFCRNRMPPCPHSYFIAAAFCSPLPLSIKPENWSLSDVFWEPYATSDCGYTTQFLSVDSYSLLAQTNILLHSFLYLWKLAIALF